MPGLTVAPNSPTAGGLGPSSSSPYAGMSVAEIKTKAKAAVFKDARGFSPLSLIKSARNQIILAKEHESKSELKSALSAYIKAASLASMTVDSSEYNLERGKTGAVRKELEDFMQTYGNDMTARTAAIEEKLKTTEQSQSIEETLDTNRPITKPGGSIQDRVRALQNHGMDISTKRISRDSSNMPPSPMSPKRLSVSSPGTNLTLLSTLSPPKSISTTSSQHTLVSPSTLGPPSPSSSPSSSPIMNNMKNLDISGFAQAFPSIDELNEDPKFSLPSVPMGINGGSAKSSKKGTISDEPPSVPSIRDFVPMERPSSTPVQSVTNAFASRPASPSKSTFPPKSSGLLGNAAPKIPIPVKNCVFPEDLRNYIRDHKVLLIDVRDREEFEREHIKATAIICIEPSILLRENVSEEMLEDAMVIAPKQEQSLFTNRDKFDLVAVYDQSSTTFGAYNTPLSVLVRAIKEQSFRKVLKRMPMMLVGGFEAWKQVNGDLEVTNGDTALSSGQSSGKASMLEASVATLPISGSTLPPSTSPSYTGSSVGGMALVTPSLIASPSMSSPPIDAPQSRSPRVGPHTVVNDHRHQYSLDQMHGHSRSPAEFSYPGSHYPGDMKNGLARRPAMSRPASNSISYTRNTIDGMSNGHQLSNGISSTTSITYPQLPRRISPTTSGSNSASTTAAFPSPVYQTIASPPQASINPSHFSRKRSDYIDQSQEALSNINHNRGPVDYPEIPVPQLLRPPPAAASPTLERQNKRVQHVPPSALPPKPAGPKPPRIDSDYPVTYWSDVQVGMSGLKNMGNTCYMNAPMQCLSATVPFARFFTDGRWKSAINFTNPLGSKGKLTGAFATLVHDMWLGDLPYLTPFEFRNSICQLKSEFKGNDQHDSQEFLSFLLDGIHEDLNRVMVKPTITQTPEQEAELERLPAQIASEREWRAWRTRNDSLIVDFFQGQFRSRLQCLTCHKTSTTFNVFSILQLPIPHTKNGKVPVERCLDAFFNEEVLEKDDAWDCPQCKTKRKATKKLSLARLPPILLVQLKRFEANGRFSDKIDTFVEYPMNSLDLTNYMPPPLPPGADKTQLNGGLPMSPDDPRTQMSPYRYDLYAVTNHYGNLSSGHYTAFIASRGGWMYCDDSSVRPVDPKQVVNQKAYVLFYKRIRA
ncbi:hypothetical protein AX17_005944 [Amanita inopinata Kibby_2008]|nr:hypothetical protein AX17_005944 [Amanita inopinata Kibby_2008]